MVSIHSLALALNQRGIRINSLVECELCERIETIACDND